VKYHGLGVVCPPGTIPAVRWGSLDIVWSMIPLASSGPIVVGVTIVAALVLMAILLRIEW
jgi:hypothetical protein